MRAVSRTTFCLLIGLIALFAAGKVVMSDTMDPDAFWHLKTADRLASEGIGPLVDDLSFSSVREPWTPYSWLAELCMKAVWDSTGLRGAVAFTALLAAGFVVLLSLAATQCEAPSRVSSLSVVLATAFGAYLSLPNLSFRPVTMAIVLLAVCAVLLLRDRRLGERTRAIWAVPPLTALLINLHLAAMLVPCWLAALLVGALCEPGEDRARRVKRYSLILGATLLACLMTPMLPGMLRTIAHFQSTDPMIGAGLIAELRPGFAGLQGVLTGLLLAVIVATMLVRRSRIRVGELLWLSGMLLLAARHNRFMPMLAMIACPLVAQTLPKLSDKALGNRLVAGVAALVLAFGLIRVVSSLPSSRTDVSHWLNRNGSEAPGYPTAAADFVATRVTPSSGRIINEFSWGGYLAWRLSPDFKVLLDERTQLFAPSFWQRAYLGDIAEQRALLAAAGADAAIIPVDRSHFRESLKSMGWKSAFRDARAEVLVPPESTVARIE